MDSFIGLPVLLGFFFVALVLGIVVSRTNFCTMGAVSDWVNMNDFGRLGAWLLAVVVAMISVVVLEASSVIDLNQTRPPYRSALFAWLRYLLGGLMFGVGMTLAGGCVSRNLVRFGGGNLKSLITLMIAAFFAFLMTKTVFFEIAFYNWMHPLSFDLSTIGITTQDVGTIVASVTSVSNVLVIRSLIAVIVAAVVIWFILKTNGIRNNIPNITAGLIVGLAVTAGWYLSTGPMGMEWAEAAEWADVPPVGVGPQSYTFVNPLGEFISLFVETGGLSVLLTVGMLGAVGLIIGSLIDALISRRFHITWFVSFKDFIANAVGGVLMGTGGVLALGCTIGQGVSGLSTLALGSVIALAAIIFGSAATLKVQFYKLVYEDAAFLDALITAFVDLKLLPSTMRRLENL